MYITPHWWPWGSSNRLLYWFQNHKIEQLSIAMLVFPLLVAKFPVKYPCTITVIAINTIFVILIFSFHGGCFQIFHIWNNRLLGDPFWELTCWTLGLIPIRTISILFALHFIWQFLTQLCKFTDYLVEKSPPESLSFPLWFLLR